MSSSSVYVRQPRHRETWGLFSGPETLTQDSLRAAGAPDAWQDTSSWRKLDLDTAPSWRPRSVGSYAQLVAQLPGVVLEGAYMDMTSDSIHWHALPGAAVPSADTLQATSDGLPGTDDGLPYHGEKIVVWAVQQGQVRPLGFHLQAQVFDDSDLPGMAVHAWAPMGTALTAQPSKRRKLG